MDNSIRLTVAILLMLAGFSGPVYPATFTVTTASDNDCSDLDCDLQAALTTAQNNDEADTINIGAGTFDASAATFTYLADDGTGDATEENFGLTLTGAGETQTLLDGGTIQRTLEIRTLNGLTDDSNADITIQNLTIQRGHSTVLEGGGLRLITDAADVMIQNTTFTQNTTDAFGAGADIQVDSGNIVVTDSHFLSNTADNDAGGAELFVDTGSIIMINNIFFNNQATTDVGGGALVQYDSGNGQAGQAIIIVHNTIVNNTSGGDGGGLYIGTDENSETVDIFNNIIFGNTAGGNGNDIFLNDDGDNDNTGNVVRIFNNDFSDLFSGCANTGGCTPNVDEQNTLNVDPLLVDLANGDFHLQSGSPVIDQGTATAPQLPTEDFEGDPRNLGANPDMGADESSACGDGTVNSNAGEQCDNGTDNSDTVADACRTDCSNPRCGDGVVDTGEQCDDGNTTAGDGCDSTCTDETSTTASNSGGCSLIRR